MKVTALIVDDEPLARAGLRNMLRPIEWIDCIGEADNGPAAVEMINALTPDLVFLDIRMPGMSGVELLPHLRHHPFVIFTTAFAQHAATAFELGALDYVLKPFGPERLQTTLERVRAALGEPTTTSPFDRLGEALGAGPISRLFVRSGRAIVPVSVDQVTWFEALGDYVAAYSGKHRHVLYVALNRLEARLDAEKFSRVHRAHIVNLDFVAAFRRASDGSVVAELTDGTRVPVSRKRARELRRLGI